MYPYLELFGLNIPTYGLMMSLAFIVAILFSYFRAKKAGLDPDKLLNIAIIAIVTGVLGSYLLYIFVTYSFSEIIACIKDGSFSVFKSGGLVFYGGFILAALCCIWYIKAKKLSLSDYAAAIVPCIPLAHAIGRVGCFLAGCCYGKVCDTIFSVYYTNPIGGAPVGVPVFPVQLMEAALNLVLFAILLIYTRKRIKAFSVLFVYLIGYSIVRFSTELMRDDEIRGIFLGLSTSQWISILLFVVGVVGLILMRTDENKKYALEEAQNAAGSQAADSETEISSSSVDAAAPAEAESDSADADSSTQDIQGKLEE